MICYVYVHVNLAPLTFVGAWSMALLLGQPLEFIIIIVHVIHQSQSDPCIELLVCNAVDSLVILPHDSEIYCHVNLITQSEVNTV